MTPSPVTIRPLTLDDTSEVAAIYAHYVRNSVVTFEEVPPTSDETRTRFAQRFAENHPAFAAVETLASGRTRLLGYAYAATFRPRPAYRHTVEDTIYLHPDATGQGLGKRLLTALIAECQARGFAQMLAMITGGTDASIRLHESCGFTRNATLPGIGFKQDRWLDVLIYQRKL